MVALKNEGDWEIARQLIAKAFVRVLRVRTARP